MKIIPFDSSISADQKFNVNLGEMVCEFNIRWNIRAQAWFCNFVTSTGSNNGVRIVENSNLLKNQNSLGVTGDFRAVRMTKSGVDFISYDNFGKEWSLVYGTQNEWLAYDKARALER